MMGMCQWQRARAYAVGLYVQEPLANKFAASEEKQAAGTDNGSSARALLMGGAGAGSRRLVLIMNQDGARGQRRPRHGSPELHYLTNRVVRYRPAWFSFLQLCGSLFRELPAVGGKHIAHGFDKSLIPRVRTAQARSRLDVMSGHAISNHPPG